jgi:hypothetical protein
MKKHQISHVDLSEIAAVTLNPERIQMSTVRLKALGAINGNGEVNINYLNTLSGALAAPFYAKLKRRLSRGNEIIEFYDLMDKLRKSKEYTAMYLYLSIMYGFLEWQVPEPITHLPAVPDALITYLGEFMADLEELVFEDIAASDSESDGDTADEQDDAI